LALPLALFLGTAELSITVLSAPAAAEWEVFGSDIQQEDGSVESLYREKGDGDLRHYKMVTCCPNGTWQEVSWWDYPNPDDPTGGKGTEPLDVADLLKKVRGVSVDFRANVEDTPLGQWINREGNGFVPHWNNDSDKGPGQAPQGHTGGLTPKQLAQITRNINFVAKSLAAIGNSMGDGVDGLAGESAPTPSKNNGGSASGKGTSGGSGNSDNKNKWRGGGEAVTLGPRPDLVNPAPKNRTGSSRLLAPALLHTKARLPHSGLTLTGSPNRGSAPGANLG
jgi:hypothetical protein